MLWIVLLRWKKSSLKEFSFSQASLPQNLFLKGQPACKLEVIHDSLILNAIISKPLVQCGLYITKLSDLIAKWNEIPHILPLKHLLPFPHRLSLCVPQP